MKPLLFICYRRCSTCRKAEAFLKLHDIPYTYREIDKENPTAEELAGWIPRSSLEARRFFNTSGQLYRQQGVKDKLAAGMTEAEQIALLATDGMMVKRPLLVGEGFVTAGFKESTWAQLLGITL